MSTLSLTFNKVINFEEIESHTLLNIANRQLQVQV